MNRSRARKLTASALAVGVAVGINADAASAGVRIVQTGLNQGHLARGSANSAPWGGYWHWSGIRTTEIQNTLFFWDTICGYQGGRSIVYFPTGQASNGVNSSFHAGCTFGTAYFDFGERYLTSLYGIKTKWKSNHTTNADWIEIGTLTPG